MNLRVCFFGTPEFAGDLLGDMLLQLPIDVSFVVTQPDRPIGRKKIVTPSPVKQIAQKNNIEIFESLDIPLSRFNNIDIAIIYYYGKIIPSSFLELPTHGFWNIHFSKLPQYRGATPATYSLMMGDTTTAVSLVATDLKLDHGLLIAQDKAEVLPDETRLELERKLHNMLIPILSREIKRIDTFKSNLTEQDHSKATYTIIPSRDHGFIPVSILQKAFKNAPLNNDEVPSLIQEYCIKNKIDPNVLLDLSSSGNIIYNYYRGLHTWPGIWTTVGNKRIKILDASLVNSQLHINTIQFEGEKPKSFTEASLQAA